VSDFCSDGSRVLVTGGAGFIGNHVALALIEKGERPVIVDNFNDYYDTSLKEARIRRLPEGSYDLYRVDVSDYPSMERIFREYSIGRVCHLAAQAGVRYSLENPFAYESSNMLGTLNLMELCRHNKVPRMVFASSSSVYGKNMKIPFSETDRVDHPISLYAATKKANELYGHVYHHLFGLEMVGLRFFTVYGPWGRPDMAAFLFADAMEKGEAIKVFNHGKMKRDFTYIDDIVSGVMAALQKPVPGGYQIFNLGNHRTVELDRFISIIEENVGVKAQRQLLPMQPGDVAETFADIDLAREHLGYEPKTSIEEGVASFIGWFKQWKSGSFSF
jgi:UDP-glucuronate 4-epimerase